MIFEYKDTIVRVTLLKILNYLSPNAKGPYKLQQRQ